jgi:hypothetical protein
MDISFVIGTGLNSSTTENVGLIGDVNNGVYAYGSFTLYSASTIANRIIRLTTSGKVNSDWYVGTGFNGTVLEVEKVLGDRLLISGSFTSFNGITLTNGLIVLNANGTIYRTFTQNYKNIFTIDKRFYGNLVNGSTELICDETLPTFSPERLIIVNSGVKYYTINILKNEPWSVSKVDIGFGTSWVNITTTSGVSSGECVIRVEEKVSQSPPQVYQSRSIILRFNFNGVIRDFSVTQNGLEQ